MKIAYTDEKDLSPEEFIDVLERANFAERRPVADHQRIQTMITNANIVLCARDGDKLIGVSRAVTDFCYCCYLSDLAIDAAYQKQGIGKELMSRTHQLAGAGANLLLLAAPDAMTYYEKIGMTPVTNGWMIDRAG